MRLRTASLISALLVAAATLFLGVAPAHAWVFPLTPGPHRIATASGLYAPAIWGTTLVYRDASHLYSVDLRTGSKKRLTSVASHKSSIDMWGTKVVWTDYRNGTGADNGDIYCLDLSVPGSETRLTTSTATQSRPAIWGDRVAYWDRSGAHTAVAVFDMSTGLETRIDTGMPDTYYAPSIYGDDLVWSARSGSAHRIFHYDIETGQVRHVTPSEGRYSGPSTWNGKVAFQSGAYILLVDLDTSSETTVTWAHTVLNLELTGTTVVWNERHFYGEIGGEPLIHDRLAACDIASGQRRLLVLDTLQDANVYGTLVAYSVGSVYEMKTAASVGAPVAPSRTMSRTRYYSITGNLRPQHTAGSFVGRLQLERYYSGRWHRVSREYATYARDYSTYSQYVARGVRLPYAGRWRIRAWHYDGTHASSFSSWRYVTVK